jgi:heme-degrading monooxygenase HmoA
MYAVIFRAEINTLDQNYAETAAGLRELAKNKYGCTGFVAVTEGNREITLSYWPSLEHIKAWKEDPEHQAAQELGRTRWYTSYKVQVVKIEREYGNTLPMGIKE